MPMCAAQTPLPGALLSLLWAPVQVDLRRHVSQWRDVDDNLNSMPPHSLSPSLHHSFFLLSVLFISLFPFIPFSLLYPSLPSLHLFFFLLTCAVLAIKCKTHWASILSLNYTPRPSLFLSEAGSPWVAQTDLELVTLLPQSRRCLGWLAGTAVPDFAQPLFSTRFIIPHRYFISPLNPQTKGV